MFPLPTNGRVKSAGRASLGVKTVLNGVETGLDDSLGRGSCVLKEEPASFPGSVATELGDDYGSVAPEEESVSEEV